MGRPSNEKLIAEIEELAKTLEKTVETKDLDNGQLQALVQELRNEAEPPKPAVTPKPVTPKPSGLRVCRGRSVTSKKGILDSGTPCSPKDFEGGQTTVDALLKRGILEN